MSAATVEVIDAWSRQIVGALVRLGGATRSPDFGRALRINHPHRPGAPAPPKRGSLLDVFAKMTAKGS